MNFPQEILTIICNYCGDTVEQKQMKLWKSIIPHRAERGSNTRDIFGAVYWFTNKNICDGLVVEWMKPEKRAIRHGSMLNIIDYRY